MLTKCDYTNLETSVTYSFNSDFCPLRRFEPKLQIVTNTDRKKMQQHGVNPAFGSRGGMAIDLEGDLFGDSSTDYVAKRKTLVTALFAGTNANRYTNRSNGRLTVGLAGESEDWFIDVIISEWSGPVLALSPGRTDFLLTLFGWLPYFNGVTTPANRYYW
jgi:hypothetical protein